MPSLYDFQCPRLDGTPCDLSEFSGKVVLVVNVASRCGFTPQYEGLEALFQKYGPQGFVILGFPCNQFGAQEPGDAEEISQFCRLEYGVTFPMFAKVEVNGSDASPLFEFLKTEAPGALGTRPVKWNFTKFLIDREGQVVRRFAPTKKPGDLAAAIERLL